MNADKPDHALAAMFCEGIRLSRPGTWTPEVHHLVAAYTDATEDEAMTRLRGDISQLENDLQTARNESDEATANLAGVTARLASELRKGLPSVGPRALDAKLTAAEQEAEVLAMAERILGEAAAALENDCEEPSTLTSEWVRRERHDGDPLWQAEIGTLLLLVSVECPWVWSWEVQDENSIDLARGDIYIEHEDDTEDDWDYQQVEQAQRRCEAVANGIVLEGVET